jgi:hypothetical protein
LIVSVTTKGPVFILTVLKYCSSIYNTAAFPLDKEL